MGLDGGKPKALVTVGYSSTVEYTCVVGQYLETDFSDRKFSIRLSVNDAQAPRDQKLGVVNPATFFVVVRLSEERQMMKLSYRLQVAYKSRFMKGVRVLKVG